ncbi:hypothetical protein DTO013E5_6304 [Penicillium roqueforti]|uniref:uncharacterized protein n=1 Tax=Penicillium roqueforti TaxID=5082 RepID=UPI00190A23CA|nr:uncharacterized protein LCP9604111_5269 [Penicillium roqueforti]KAF9248519.1 hypothetical protein LCP9604111_5269 [Penicillium roqueforti]KAI1831033.1 hypothetical protein CBS147337_8099 [Penicillium roqueforti]KAI2674116.1 hypothetical protein CBS147355_7291 [Penicillium roqueforti]KAI2682119.1 hypothetical protein LCP963914a_6534 [Penicillium roqueforti]KAI2699253.1 hypothetical protein CBS147372_6500 [Penicillium roqueforti]
MRQEFSYNRSGPICQATRSLWKLISFHPFIGLFLWATTKWRLSPRTPLWNKILGLWRAQIRPAYTSQSRPLVDIDCIL